MSLFQKSVLKKYLNELDNEKVHKAFTIFSNYFHNSEIQHNILESKEEQFQEGFLRELFVKVFGYVLNPLPEFNLTTEFKNERGAKKADGAVLKDGKAIAVIELKSSKTKDLESIRQQAFDYKANHSDCVYVITSNFRRLRFYVNNAVEFEEFDLFSLNEDQFKLLYLCLNSQHILNGLPLKIKTASILEEENISKKFYADYSLFKQELFENIADKNIDIEGVSKLQLYKKTQKLLDRFLFIFFAEDRGLLPPNSISRMIQRWNVLNDEDAYKPLYEIYKQYFGYLNVGRKGKVPEDDIQAYNGGLFLPDEILDKIEIDDEVLLKHTSKLTNYDFESQVDVNILGHIFEHSLNEIENTTAELEGVVFDKQKSKRKKDGVFYTPKYITKYIVDNTVGKLCSEKKEELGIVDTEYIPNRQKETKKKLLANIEAYREWLLELTICDPACGSGAFLNQALEFLINEHHYIDGLNAQLFGSAMVFQDVENQILEKNIYGVDINEESVDIARLSLWLRTAQRGRKLTSLNKNIKCGNSLIDDPDVAGDKAFNWEKEFPEVFDKGGFDVVIGNPPYVTRGMSKILKEALNSNFETAQYQLDLYVSFIEKGVKLTGRGGAVSFIVPNSWLKNMMMSACRKFLLNNLDIKYLIPSLENVFPDASVDTMIFIGIKQEIGENTQIAEFREKDLYFRHKVSQLRFLLNKEYIFDVEVSKEVIPIMDKMTNDVSVIGELFDVARGINPYDKYRGQLPEIIKSRAYHAEFKKDDTFVPELKGLHISRYNYTWDKKHYISYGNWLAAPRDIKYFEGPRIIFREILGRTLVSTLITEDFKIDRSLYIAKLEESSKSMFDIKYVLGILNSKLMAFYFRFANNEFDNLFPKIRVAEFKNLPIRNLQFELQDIISMKVESIISTSKEFRSVSNKFIKYLFSQFHVETFSKKLQNWHELEFGEFISELNKAIKKAGGEKLSKMDEMEWMEVFEAKKAEVQSIKAVIDKTDMEIDGMVYELYGLTENEIKIVEESVK